MSKFIHPDYIRIIEKKTEGWFFKPTKPFFTRLQVDFNDFELLYGITQQHMLIELFRLNGGKVGFYIANLRYKQFYYCGTDADAVKPKLLEIGIGRTDPHS